MKINGAHLKKRVICNWSPDISYAVGLIATDGCLSKDKRHIDFTSKDVELIKTFQKCLSIQNIKIGYKQGGFGGRCPRVQFGDVHFYQWLEKIGLMPHKSKIIGRLRIPDEFFFDFLRGCFDGDGSIYAFWDPRWHSSYMFYLQFTSASIVYLEWLQSTIYRLSNVQGRIKTSTRCYHLVYAKAGTRMLLNKMFYSKRVSCLKRKLVKAQKIINIDNKHNACPGGGTW